MTTKCVYCKQPFETETLGNTCGPCGDDVMVKVMEALKQGELELERKRHAKLRTRGMYAGWL